MEGLFHEFFMNCAQIATFRQKQRSPHSMGVSLFPYVARHAGFNGGPRGGRTHDLRIKSPLLYH